MPACSARPCMSLHFNALTSDAQTHAYAAVSTTQVIPSTESGCCCQQFVTNFRLLLHTGASTPGVRKSAFAAMTKRQQLSQDVISRMEQTATAQSPSATAKDPWHNPPAGRANRLSTESVDGRQSVTASTSATSVVAGLSPLQCPLQC